MCLKASIFLFQVGIFIFELVLNLKYDIDMNLKKILQRVW